MRANLAAVSATTFLLLAAVSASAQTAPAGAIELSAIREAAARGMAAIQTAQKMSRTTQSCAGTCHLQGYGSMAYRSAREHGIVLDEDVAQADATKANRQLASDFAAAVERNALGEVAMTTAFRLVSAHAVGLRPSMTTAALARALALQQNPDGDWPAMTTRPPSNYSSFSFTAFGLRALQLYAHPSQARDVAARVGRARAWLQSHQPRQTEDRSYQLLGLSWAGSTRRQLTPLARALVREQRPDGGWTSLDGRPTDAYATGQALVALHDSVGMSLEDDAWKRGIAFLLRTQAADGTWHVATRLPPWVSPPYYESGYPYGRDQFISVAGASWATMALTRALGTPTTPDRLPLDALSPPVVEPWVEAALFGDAGQLKRLLDTGLSPNAATAAGSVPLLSLVVPDLEKTRLLLARGADVNTRSQARFSPLLVAAQYASATPVIRLLLDRNADIGVPAGAPPPLANAYPTAFAAHAGNAAILPLLNRAGDRVDTAFNVIGGNPRTPLTVAVILGRRDAARVLLDLGAAVDQTNPNGRTALAAAVLGHRTELVQLLLARGANVNYVDSAGMTPLMYAATIDFGDAAVVDLLLRAGARAEMRDLDGLTALERARRGNHTHAIRSLETWRATPAPASTGTRAAAATAGRRTDRPPAP
jgi:ankyrin repeat protein